MVTDTIYFIFHKYKPKYRQANYVRAVCDVRPHKTETHRKRLAAGGNLIQCTGDVSTPTSDLTNIKLHVNRFISDFKARYICMDVKYFYLNKMIDRAEDIVIQIVQITQSQTGIDMH